MTLAVRLVLLVALTAVASAALTGYLSYRAASDRVPRAFGMAMGHGMGAGPMAPGLGPGAAAAASHHLLGELQDVTLRSALLALAAAVAAGTAMAVRTSRPLRHLADVTRRYGAGERDARAAVRGGDEVAALARVFNETADRLQEEEARRLRLTTDVAHELRTPLTVLKSELEAMQDGLMTPDRAGVDALLQQVDLLARLVADLRLLTSAESGALALERRPVPLDEVVEGAARAFTARAAERGVRVAVSTAPVTVLGDADRLRQVVYALLDNAVRHAREGGEVHVTVRPVDGRARLEVGDDGPGIDPAHLPYVFERFYRADADRGRASGGSGLGLAIVAAIAELHGGRAEAANAAGGGARLRIELPAVTP